MSCQDFSRNEKYTDITRTRTHTRSKRILMVALYCMYSCNAGITVQIFRSQKAHVSQKALSPSPLTFSHAALLATQSCDAGVSSRRALFQPDCSDVCDCDQDATSVEPEPRN